MGREWNGDQEEWEGEGWVKRDGFTFFLLIKDVL